MKTKIKQITAAVALMTTSAVALAATSDCCVSIECCINMLSCCF